MGRLLAYLAFFAIVIALCYGLYLAARHVATRRRQKLAAKFAPELLRHENLPKEVVNSFIEQRKQLGEIESTLRRMIDDPFFTLNTDYYNLINDWLKGQQQKEIK